MSTNSISNDTSGQQLMVAAMAKKQQMADGQTALALIEASAPVQAPSQPAASSNPSIGQHINIRV